MTCEAEINRIAGEIALKAPKPNAAKAEAYFDAHSRLLVKQQAKSWALRGEEHGAAAPWRDQGKRERPASLSLQSMAGLPRASTRST